MYVTHISWLNSNVACSITSTHRQICVSFLVYLLKTYTTTCSTTNPSRVVVFVWLHFVMHLYNGYCIKLTLPSKNFYSFVFVMLDYMLGWAAAESNLSHRQLLKGNSVRWSASETSLNTGSFNQRFILDDRSMSVPFVLSYLSRENIFAVRTFSSLSSTHQHFAESLNLF